MIRLNSSMGFLRKTPSFFAEMLQKMYERWKGLFPLQQFYGKAALYQLVYGAYEKLSEGHIDVFQPDVVGMAIRYLDEYYHDSVSIQSLANMLNVSYSHLHRSFKQRTGKSPQEYLVGVRLCSAKKRLHKSNASIQEIAVACGFPDEFIFSRLFLKHEGLTPKEFREKLSINVRDLIMDSPTSFSYNEGSLVRIDKLKEEGTTVMLNRRKSKMMIAAAISLMMVLSACSTMNTNTPTGQLSGKEAKQSMEQSDKRIISTVAGDVEVPENPQRIAAFGQVGDLLAMGLKPIGGDNEIRLFDGLLNEDEYTFVIHDDYEALLELEPDLIILS